MGKLVRLLSAVAALLVGLGVSAGAQAASAPAFVLTVNADAVYSGQQLLVTARSRAACSWVIEWHGERRVARGQVIRATFTAPVVTAVTRIPLRARCFYDTAPSARHRVASPPGGDGTAAQRLSVTVPPSHLRTLTVTVTPSGSTVSPPESGTGSPGPGDLPGTGGPAVGYLGAGLGAVLLGFAAVRASRRAPSRFGGRQVA